MSMMDDPNREAVGLAPIWTGASAAKTKKAAPEAEPAEAKKAAPKAEPEQHKDTAKK